MCNTDMKASPLVPQFHYRFELTYTGTEDKEAGLQLPPSLSSLPATSTHSSVALQPVVPWVFTHNLIRSGDLTGDINPTKNKYAQLVLTKLKDTFKWISFTAQFIHLPSECW